MTAPRGLQSRGKALYRSVVAGLPDGWELDERELELLHLAARQADDLARLEAEVEAIGVTIRGSAGQIAINPVLSEARQARLAIARLVGQIQLPDEDSKPHTEASRRGRHAATARWERHARVRSLREAASGAA